MNGFGEWMQAVRLAKGLRPGQAALLVGVSYNVLNSWESGRRLPGMTSLDRWTRGLNLDAETRALARTNLAAAVGARRVG